MENVLSFVDSVKAAGPFGGSCMVVGATFFTLVLKKVGVFVWHFARVSAVQMKD